MNNKENLRKWRKERHIKEAPTYEVYMRNILEELLEPCYYKVDIPEKVNDIMEQINIPQSMNDNEVLDALSDIIVFSINQTELMGYDNEKALSETIKEIACRKQDPKQKEKWDTTGYDGAKWQKDLNQDKSTLYVADYDKAKL